MEKRVIIAVLLSVAVLVLFNFFFRPPEIKKPLPAQTAQTQPGKQAAPATPQPQATPAPPAAKPAPEVAEAPAKDITINTDLYTAVISTRGGVIKSWKLKKYKDASGNPLEMVQNAPMKPLIVAPDGVQWQDAEKYPYSADKDRIDISGKDTGTLTLTYSGPDGKSIVKALDLTGDNYDFGLDVKTSGINFYTVYMGEGFGNVTENEKRAFVGALTYVDGSKEKDNPEKLTALKTYQGKSGWTCITEKYFMGAIRPDDGLKAIVGRGEQGLGFVGVDATGPDRKFLVYAGPKEYDRLKALGGNMQLAVDFGWFTFLAKPLFFALRFFYGLVHNWGWAIIILTVIVKLIFAPLTHKSQKSMKKLQKLQPLFAELKEKYKGDPQRLNREMMELYKKHQVNPMGGCLPMLIQIPVFIALYNVLNNAIELRGAPFAFWLHDLSAKDPYYILPILMGLSMLAMQKMTPTSMDPKQNMMMMIMPVVLTFMFISLPSGLVLYFTVSNLLSMAQQIYINKYSKE